MAGSVIDAMGSLLALLAPTKRFTSEVYRFDERLSILTDWMVG